MQVIYLILAVPLQSTFLGFSEILRRKFRKYEEIGLCDTTTPFRKVNHLLPVVYLPYNTLYRPEGSLIYIPFISLN